MFDNNVQILTPFTADKKWSERQPGQITCIWSTDYINQEIATVLC